MRAQIFTIDLVLGAIIILSILGGAYGLSSYYSYLNQASISNADLNAQISSAITSFMIVTQTRTQLDNFQVGITSASTFENYTINTLGEEIGLPYSISVYALETYSEAIPNVQLLSYASNGFENGSAIEAFSEPIIVTNQTSLCGSACNFSLQAQSAFPGENLTVNAAKCNVYTNKGSGTGWGVFNNTPAGYCTIQVGSYAAGALPNNYLVKAYNSTGSFEGNTTLYVLGLDLIQLKIQK